MALYEWILEMDAIYFDINPEMGLQAQQDFQTLVYEHLYTIISFLILFQQYANDYEFFQQFLNNDGVPFRPNRPAPPDVDRKFVFSSRGRLSGEIRSPFALPAAPPSAKSGSLPQTTLPDSALQGAAVGRQSRVVACGIFFGSPKRGL